MVVTSTGSRSSVLLYERQRSAKRFTLALYCWAVLISLYAANPVLDRS
jgi:hypothetical protein